MTSVFRIVDEFYQDNTFEEDFFYKKMYDQW